MDSCKHKKTALVKQGLFIYSYKNVIVTVSVQCEAITVLYVYNNTGLQ